MHFGSCETMTPPAVKRRRRQAAGERQAGGMRGCRDRVLLLNQCTDVINFWQEEERKTTIEDARAKYPGIVFQGA